MRVLMISLDRSLLGASQLGDALVRHMDYGQYVKRLDIIVFSAQGFKPQKISERVYVWPTNSRHQLFYYFDAKRIGREIYKQNRFELIVCQDPFLTGLAGWALKKNFRVPLLLHCHGDFWNNPHWRKEQWFNPFLLSIGKRLIVKADALRVVTPAIKDELVKLKIPSDKIHVISTPVDFERFKNADLKEVQKIKNEFGAKKIILSVGRLVLAKDLPNLLKALKIVREKNKSVVCLILGKGPLKNQIKALIEEFELSEAVKLIGKIDTLELPPYYQAAEFLVMSSTNESFGKVILEAAAAKIPTVSTATTGAASIIKDGQTGLLVPIRDSQKLAEAIMALLASEEKRRNFGQAAYADINERFGYQKNIDKIIGLWQSLINKK